MGVLWFFRKSLVFPLALLPAAFAEPQRVAILLGFNSYDSLPDLPSVAFDLQRMDTVLRAEGHFDVRRIVANDPQGVRAELASATANLGEADLLLLYIAGHGVEVPRSVAESGSVLFLPGANESRCDGAWLSIEQIDGIAAEGGAGTRIYLVDACRGVRLSDSVEGMPGCLAIPPTLPAFPASPRVVLAAADAGELASEAEGLGGGTFTVFAALGLAGAADSDNDGVVGVSELGGFLQRSVADYSCGRQHATTALATNARESTLSTSSSGGWSPVLVDDRVAGCQPGQPAMLDGTRPSPGLLSAGVHQVAVGASSAPVAAVAGERYEMSAWAADVRRRRGPWLEFGALGGWSAPVQSDELAWEPFHGGGLVSFLPPDTHGSRPIFRLSLAGQASRFDASPRLDATVGAGWRWGELVYAGPTLDVSPSWTFGSTPTILPAVRSGAEVGLALTGGWFALSGGANLGLVDQVAGAEPLLWPYFSVSAGVRIPVGL